MTRRFLFGILIVIGIGNAQAQQDIIIPGIGSTVWIQEHKGADTRISIRTPFIDFFKNINLWKPRLALGIGLGISSYNVMLDNLIAVDSNKQVNFSNKNIKDVKKYKLNTTYLELPVEFRYRQDPDKHKHPLKVGLGARFCYLVSSHTKTEYYPSGSVSKSKDYDIQYLNNFTYGPQFRIGWSSIGLLAFYDMQGLFDDNHSSKIHQCLLALCFNLSFDKDKLNLPGIPPVLKPSQSALGKQKPAAEAIN